MGPSDTARPAVRLFRRLLGALRRLYGTPKPPDVTDPFELIVAENVAYLANDERRAEALAILRKRVGLEPRSILQAPISALRDVGEKGILPGKSASKLRAAAEVALEEFGGDLQRVLRLPLAEAKKALRKFPSIGEPAAEKILLFSRSHPVFSLDSNALRVLLRIGYGKEERSYAATYRRVREDLTPVLPTGFDSLIEAYQLLRRHGQELCTRSHPRCDRCPLRRDCAYASERDVP